jgi:hypothetical protein
MSINLHSFVSPVKAASHLLLQYAQRNREHCQHTLFGHTESYDRIGQVSTCADR